jgi:NAD(P)-dependent dehydrogenase (short-subunit alcohol dehydrogenase family)
MPVTERFSLEGKVAAVVGGTGVLGGTFCRGVADAGASVAVLGRSAERGAAVVAELERAGHAALAVSVEPEELVGAIVWLASERAAGCVTGALICVDGGFSAMTI